MSASMSADNHSKRRPLKAWEFRWSKVSPEERERALSAVGKAHAAPVKPSYPAPARTPSPQVQEKPFPSIRPSAVHPAMHPSKRAERIQPSFMDPVSETHLPPSLRAPSAPPPSPDKTPETLRQGDVISFPSESLRIDLKPEIERLTQLSAAEAAARRAAERREREALSLKEQAERLAKETSEKAKAAEAALREVRQRSSDTSAEVERLRAGLMEETARRDDAERRLREAEARLQSASDNRFRQPHPDRPSHADEPDANVVFGRPAPGLDASLRRPVVERMGVLGSKGHPGREVQVIRQAKLSDPVAPHVTGRLTLASFGGDEAHADQTDADRQREEDRRRRAEEIRERVAKSPMVRSVSALIMLVQASERASGEKREELFAKASDTFATVRKLMTSLENRLLGSMLSAETDASS